jgi:hypothetical protein
MYKTSDFLDMGAIRIFFMEGAAAKFAYKLALKRFKSNFSDCHVASRIEEYVLINNLNCLY